MKNATKYLVVGSLGVLMTRRDISSLAVKGLIIRNIIIYFVNQHTGYDANEDTMQCTHVFNVYITFTLVIDTFVWI